MCESQSTETAAPGDDNIFEESLNHKLRRCIVVLRVADAVDDDCYVALGDIRKDFDLECPVGDGPGGLGEGSRANRVPDPGGLVEGVEGVLEGEGDGDLGMGVDGGVGEEEEGVVGE